MDTDNRILINKIMQESSYDTIECISINSDYPTFDVLRENIHNMYIVIVSISEK